MMNISDLKPGDVLLFSPEKGSLLSEAIVFLTGAPVSHSAITYKTNKELIEQTVPIVRVANCAERFKERTIHAMRLKERPDDFTPVFTIADQFLANEEPYGMSNLYLVGALLLYKKVTPSDMMQRIMLKILMKLTSKIAKLINEKKYPGKHPMVCSDFVFECYNKPQKPEFKLTITNGNLLRGKQSTNSSPLSLLEHAQQQVSSLLKSSQNSTNISSLASAHVETHPSDEDLAGELLDALNDAENNVSNLKSMAHDISDELLTATHNFSQACHALQNKTPLEQGDATKGLQFLSEQQAMFVTPADLLEHCNELTEVGIIKI